MRKVEDIKLKKGMSAQQLVKEYAKSGGFTAQKLADGVGILKDMVKDKKSTNFLSFPACIIATGCRGVIRQMVEQKLFDVIVTTNGTLDHDLARCWKDYHHGSFHMDDRKLHKKGINRLGNILIPNKSYGIILEKKIKPIVEKIDDEIAGYELIWRLGEKAKKDSILYWAAKNKIPVIVPGFYDGAVGSIIYQAERKKKLRVNHVEDETLMQERALTAKRTGALMVGGGISKHHTIWWNQYKGGLDRIVYLTSAPEWDGSLSGARTREMVSWGKAKEKSKHVTVEGDATVNLPLMISALFDKI